MNLILCTFLISFSSTFGFRSAISSLDDKIVGGEDANISEFPYQLSLLHKRRHMCGASIISNEWVITAAHCLDGLSKDDISFRAGSTSSQNGGIIRYADEIYVHKNYNAYSNDYDYGLVKIRDSFPIGSIGIEAIPLATNLPRPGEMGVVTGWGRLNYRGKVAKQLQVVYIPIISPELCQKQFVQFHISERMICAGYKDGGKDACQGDSGGPIVVKGKLVGIVSFGIGCAEPNYPGVYSSISNQREWIKSITGL